MRLTTYGRTNCLIQEVRSFFPNKYRDELFESNSMETYNPRPKKWKVFIASFSLLGLIPGLPIWMIPIALRWALR